MKRLKEIMDERGTPAAWLARKVGVSRATILNYKKGDSEPGLSTAIKIAEALKVDVKDLV